MDVENAGRAGAGIPQIYPHIIKTGLARVKETDGKPHAIIYEKS
jgi:hypothetical protein